METDYLYEHHIPLIQYSMITDEYVKEIIIHYPYNDKWNKDQKNKMHVKYNNNYLAALNNSVTFHTHIKCENS